MYNGKIKTEDLAVGCGTAGVFLHDIWFLGSFLGPCQIFHHIWVWSAELDQLEPKALLSCYSLTYAAAWVVWGLCLTSTEDIPWQWTAGSSVGEITPSGLLC